MYYEDSSSSSSSEDEIFIPVRRRKIYKKRLTLEDFNDSEVFERFRLKRETIIRLLQEVEAQIALPSNRGGCIQPITQLLLTLRFYATGSVLLAIGDFSGVSKASGCRIVQRVSRAIASLAHNYIKMYEIYEEMAEAVEKFYALARFPRVIGAIDCTLIKIQSPGGNDAEIFRCRKGFFALNVQTVADANLRIRNIVARWPGSTHDQTVFNNSSLKRDLVTNKYRNFILLGDSGYSIQPYLMTPLLHTRTPAENLYNESLIRTRNVVERQYGVWKRRFPILSLGMRVQLPVVQSIIVATAILHNIALDEHEEIPDEWFEHPNIENNGEIINENTTGNQLRQLFINNHFTNL